MSSWLLLARLVRLRIVWLLFVLELACHGYISAAYAQTITPLKQVHAHNDYLHPRPLLDALDHGFCSVEADIFLTPEGLQVGHERSELKPGRTLEKLYLDPLRERVNSNGGSVYVGGGPTFYLLIDVKSEADATYAALDQILARYADILSETRDGKQTPRAVTVVLSGNRALDTVTKQAVRYVGLDGRPENLKSDAPADLMPWISARWGSLFAWQGQGPMPLEQRRKLNEIVEQAHARGRLVRFWATPEKDAVWKELTAADVDMINTDMLHPPSGCPFHPRCPYVLERCPHEMPPLETAIHGGRKACWANLSEPVTAEQSR